MRQRIHYYNASVFVDQLKQGENYGELLPAISICFLEDILFSETNAPHLAFSLIDRPSDTS